MKSSVNINQSIAAGDTVDVLSGYNFKQAFYTGAVQIFQTASAAGLTSAFTVANRTGIENSPVAGTGNPPSLLDEALSDFIAYRGETMTLKVSNPTAGALTFQARIVLDSNVNIA